jgi:putative ABC transport system permease protein
MKCIEKSKNNFKNKSMIIQNLKLILRGLKNNKVYSLLNIGGFAIGFAVLLTITLFIYNEITVDHTINGHERIYRIISSEKKDCNLNLKIAQQIGKDYPEVESVVPVQYITGWNLNISCEGNFAKVKDLIATDNQFFKLFNIKLIEGFSSEPFSESYSAVLTQRLARILFGDKSALGKSINISGFRDVRITGVIDNFPSNCSIYSDLFINFEDEKNRIIQSANNAVIWYPGNIYIKLKQDNDPQIFENKIDQIYNSPAGVKDKLLLQPLTRIYFEKGIANNPNRTANTSMIYLFSAIAFLILLLSVSNHVNFTLSLQYTRLRETGIKKTHGADFRHLALFHLTENTFNTLLAFTISVFITIQILPFASGLFERNLDFNNVYRYPVWLVTCLVIIMVIIITSIAPVYMSAKFDILKFLNADIFKKSGGGINNVLSIFQATVSIVLISCFITIYKQLTFAKQADLGFNKDHLIRIVLPSDFKKGDMVKQEFGKLPFIESSALSMGVPGLINSRVGSGEEGNPFWLDCLEVDEDFLKTFSVKLLVGREFHKGVDEKVCILNQTALKKYGWTDIEDKEFRNYGGLKVIGVVNDFSVSSMHSERTPVALVFKNRYMNALSLRLKAGNVEKQISLLKETWNSILPEYLFDYSFYDEYFDSLYKKEEREGLAVTIFSFLALVITLMGITGLTFQNCLSRSKEIGIRKINGARITDIMVMLNKAFINRIIIAFIIATPIAWLAMHKWLQSFAYRTELNWWIFALAGIATFGIVILTVSLQSWRTATRNPVEALRYE